MDARTLSLRFGDAVPESVRRRIAHAFHNFCGVYGFRPAGPGEPSHVRLVYGASARGAGELQLAATYVPGRAGEPPSPHAYARPGLFHDAEASAFPCLHPLAQGRSPDWLGEIFEWLGGEAEHLTDAADSVGRVPFSHSLHGRYGLDPEIPYAAVAMRGLNQDIGAAAGDGWPDRPVPPAGVGGVVLVATHDIDFLPVSSAASVSRALKNAAIAAVRNRDARLTLGILAAVVRDGLRGRSPLDTLTGIAEGEHRAGFRSASYVICARRHRRDANYRLDDPVVLATFTRLAAAGMEIGVHGSYTSLETPGALAAEYGTLRAAGFPAVGGRQHWLRRRGSRLFAELAAAGARYDSTVGYPERIGFRSGACFPYVPWDFAAQAGAPLLEIPLVVMDATLYSQFRHDVGAAEARVRRLFQRAGRYGWGGLSILWHNTGFGGAQLPRALGELYWRLKEPAHTWMTGAELVGAAGPRFSPAGFGRTAQ